METVACLLVLSTIYTWEKGGFIYGDSAGPIGFPLASNAMPMMQKKSSIVQSSHDPDPDAFLGSS